MNMQWNNSPHSQLYPINSRFAAIWLSPFCKTKVYSLVISLSPWEGEGFSIPFQVGYIE
jgi:hypothetical protein